MKTKEEQVQELDDEINDLTQKKHRVQERIHAAYLAEAAYTEKIAALSKERTELQQYDLFSEEAK